MKKTGIILAGIIIVASFLRLVNLANVPVGFHGDEAAVGYNAYALLKTGRDVNNTLLPIAVDQWGDKRPAGLHYLTIPAIALFGLTEFATRLPSALFGIATVLLFYFFVKDVFGDGTLAILATLLLALSPWHIATSRATSESIVSMFFVLAGSWALFVACKKREISKKFLLISLLLFGVSFWFYHAGRLFVPLFVGLVACQKKNLLLWGFAGTLVVLVIFFLASGGTSRPENISIFTSPQTRLIMEEKLREPVAQPLIVKRFLHNKITAYVETFARNYLAHTTGTFLFLEGGGPARYIVPWQGMMYLVDAPLLIIGFSFVVYLAFWKKNRIYQALLLWLLLAPVPAALTFEDIPNVQRAILMVSALILITAIGVREIFRLIRFYLFIIGLIVIVLYGYNVVQFGDAYFFHSFTHQPWHRNAGEKELVFRIRELLNQGKKVVSTASADNNALFYLFYLRMSPAPYQDLHGDPDRANKFLPNLKFITQDCPGLEEAKEANTIIVGTGECPIRSEAKLVGSIERPDGSVAFKFYTPVRSP